MARYGPESHFAAPEAFLKKSEFAPCSRRNAMPSVTSCWSDRSSRCAVATAARWSLSPRLFSALLLFVENAGRVARQRCPDAGAVAGPGGRGEQPEPGHLGPAARARRRPRGSRYIQTVPRRGFRFIATVTDVAGRRRPSTPAGGNDRVAAARFSAVRPRRRRPSSLRTDRSASAPASARVRRGGAGCAWRWRRRRREPGWRRAGGRRAVRRAPALRRRPRRWPCCRSSRWRRKRATSCSEVGMADSLIARLSTVPGLVVRSIGSVRRYAGADQDPLRAARELDVAWIVDGSLQRRGDQLRVTARLLRAADGVAAWSGSFDEKFTGVFEVQDAISARVAQVLAPSLEVFAGARPSRPGSAEHATPTPTSSIWLRLDTPRTCAPMACARASTLYKQALEIDPGYALAWVGLGRNPPAHAVRRRRADRRTCSSRRLGDPARPRRSSRIWPKPVPSRRSSSTGSTSTGPVPSASFGARSRSIRTWPWLTSVWRACC